MRAAPRLLAGWLVPDVQEGLLAPAATRLREPVVGNVGIVGVPAQRSAALRVVVLGREERDRRLVQHLLHRRKGLGEEHACRQLRDIPGRREDACMACDASHGVRVAIRHLALQNLVRVARVIRARRRLVPLPVRQQVLRLGHVIHREHVLAHICLKVTLIDAALIGWSQSLPSCLIAAVAEGSTIAITHPGPPVSQPGTRSSGET